MSKLVINFLDGLPKVYVQLVCSNCGEIIDKKIININVDDFYKYEDQIKNEFKQSCLKNNKCNCKKCGCELF